MIITEKYTDRMIRIHKELNKVSPTYCVAKWQQVTIHLATGQTHSCHHPVTHKIPIEELVDNPSALHNTKFKKEQRKLMLEGQRPDECDYCWRAEDAPGDHYSDRIRKSADQTWGEPYLESSAKLPWDADVIPAYVEVSFSTVCNFGCSYCSPEVSSTLMQTVKTHGPLKLSSSIDQDPIWLEQSGRKPIPNREHNPYIEAWWKWWPALYPNLRTFRITGGEPLLSKETFKTLDWIIANPNPNLDLAINTNLGVDQKLLDEFFTKCQIIKDGNMVKRLQIFTSCDTWGNQAEYIRPGLNYKKWYYNLWNLTLRYPTLDVTIMCTFNLLSIPHFKKFLNDILSIRRSATTLNKVNGIRGINLDFPYLRHPRYLSALIADEGMTTTLANTIKWAERNTATFQEFDYHDGFYPHEIDNLNRLLHIVQAENPTSKENVVARHDFYLYVGQHDTRNASNFLTTFPEFTAFYNRCKNEYDASVVAKALQVAYILEQEQ
jgi:sulfatase maturation enzyme AslB (radical SAM superfamily)